MRKEHLPGLAVQAELYELHYHIDHDSFFSSLLLILRLACFVLTDICFQSVLCILFSRILPPLSHPIGFKVDIIYHLQPTKRTQLLFRLFLAIFIPFLGKF